MVRAASILRVAVPAIALLGCKNEGHDDASVGAADTATDEGGDPTDGPADGGAGPWRDAWQVVHSGPFVALDEDGAPAIQELLVGLALGHDDNFANRGDVIVAFDGPPDTITIELRRFAWAGDAAQAQESFDKLSLWSYASSTSSPKPPAQMDVADRCDGEGDDGAPRPWVNGCAIYVWYDGQVQPARTGADIRVTLPPSYRESLTVETSDNVTEDSYPNRGNVCVTGLVGQLDVTLQSGVTFVEVAATEAYPSCPPELVADCDAFDDPATDGPDAWAADCGCFAQGYEPGRVAVESLAPSAADITIDVPADLWTSFHAENSGDNQLAGFHCEAKVDGIGPIEFTPGMDDPNRPWLRGGIANRPERAPAGGYRVELASHGCSSVSTVESPDDWAADVDPDPVPRGNLTLCSGCAAGGCEALLPD